MRNVHPRQHVVVLTGAGISAESGLRTFRDSGGLWEGFRVDDVATPEAWELNPELVLEFYNQRRRAMHSALPNAAHIALAALEDRYEVSIITQNVDDLHERAGSTSILHLHGELSKARSTVTHATFSLSGDSITLGDCCPSGGQLRPHIVWFGEPVPLLKDAAQITASADIFIIIGTSLAVYPAASLVEFTPIHCRRYLVDPGDSFSALPPDVTILKKTATKGLPELIAQYL